MFNSGAGHNDEPWAARHLDETARDAFLLDEGLDLLAAYREIRDRDLRLSLKRLIETMAKAQSKG